MTWYFRIDTFHDSLIEAFHVFGSERRIQSNQFIQHTTQGPNVRLQIIWFILPDLWTGVIRSSSLSFQNTGLGNLWNIQITEFDHTIFRQEDISTFDISMNDFLIMKWFQPQHHLVEDGPYVCFLREARSFFGIVDFGLEVTIIAVFHDNA